MYELYSSFVERILVSVGGIFVALGLIFGSTPHDTSQTPAEVATEAVTEPQALVTEKSEQKKESHMSSNSVVPKEEQQTQQNTDTLEATLQIEKVAFPMNKNGTVEVTWKTTLPSESRLVLNDLDGRVHTYESERGVNTSHGVIITGLKESEEYDFKLTASSADKTKYDDYYGVMYVYKKYVASLGGREGDCQEILIRDTAGYVSEKGKEVSVTGYVKKGGTILLVKATQSLKTDSYSKVEYCGEANSYRVIGEELNTTLDVPTNPDGA